MNTNTEQVGQVGLGIELGQLSKVLLAKESIVAKGSGCQECQSNSEE